MVRVRLSISRIWSCLIALIVYSSFLSTTYNIAHATSSVFNGNSHQVITVYAAHSGQTHAILQMWQRTSRGWMPSFAAVTAYVGNAGIGHAHEGKSITPAGVFPLTEAFGRQPNPGTLMPYFQTTPYDWWDGVSGHSTYNRHVRQASNPGADSENLYYAGRLYDYAIVIGYNLAAIPEAGSAFFLHVTGGKPTQGCISIARLTLIQILRLLRPAAHPIISIGIGQPPLPD